MGRRSQERMTGRTYEARVAHAQSRPKAIRERIKYTVFDFWRAYNYLLQTMGGRHR